MTELLDNSLINNLLTQLFLIAPSLHPPDYKFYERN